MANSHQAHNQVHAFRESALNSQSPLVSVAELKNLKVNRILPNKPLQVRSQSLLKDSTSQYADPILPYYRSLAGDADRTAAVLAGSWDAGELPYKQHDRLSLPELAANFGMTKQQLSQFMSLAEFATRSGSVSNENHGTTALDWSQMIRMAEQEKLGLESKLQSLQSPQDDEEISATLNAIKDLAIALEQLRKPRPN
ncbi:MAG: hypothetical protein R3C28_26720 [Pirellulaceae bacterium]